MLATDDGFTALPLPFLRNHSGRVLGHEATLVLVCCCLVRIVFAGHSIQRRGLRIAASLVLAKSRAKFVISP